MSFFDKLKHYSSGICLLAIAIISISFSSYQFKYDDNGNQWTPSWRDICNDSPGSMLRRKLAFSTINFNHLPILLFLAFSVKISGQDKPSYCGYSNANTGYRLAIAILTLFFAISFFFDVYDNRPLLLSGIYFGAHSLWFFALGLDINSLANGQSYCKDDFTSINGGDVTCNNSVYGITISIDAGICAAIILHFFWHILTAKFTTSDSATLTTNSNNGGSKGSLFGVI
jgi:hypothetical protein